MIPEMIRRSAQEYLELYLTYEADAVDTLTDGSEYRMVPVDQAAGSRYYVLLLVQADGKTAEVVNSDPYLGMGGAAKWIHFLDDGKTGFTCLSYSGGAKGAFYRTGRRRKNLSGDFLSVSKNKAF